MIQSFSLDILTLDTHVDYKPFIHFTAFILNIERVICNQNLIEFRILNSVEVFSY